MVEYAWMYCFFLVRTWSSANMWLFHVTLTNMQRKMKKKISIPASFKIYSKQLTHLNFALTSFFESFSLLLIILISSGTAYGFRAIISKGLELYKIIVKSNLIKWKIEAFKLVNWTYPSSSKSDSSSSKLSFSFSFSLATVSYSASNPIDGKSLSA